MKPNTRQFWSWFGACIVVCAVLAAMAFLLYGCQSSQGGGMRIPIISDLFGGSDAGQSSDPTNGDSVRPATGSLWPFTTLGFITMAAGIAELFLTGSRKLLTIGIVLALVPLGATWLLQQFAPALNWIIIPISIAIGAAGVIWIALRVGQWFEAKKSSKQAMEAVAELEPLTNGRSLSDDDKHTIRLAQQKLRQCGSIGRKPRRSARLASLSSFGGAGEGA